jgi:hypothetical protein
MTVGRSFSILDFGDRSPWQRGALPPLPTSAEPAISSIFRKPIMPRRRSDAMELTSRQSCKLTHSTRLRLRRILTNHDARSIAGTSCPGSWRPNRRLRASLAKLEVTYNAIQALVGMTKTSPVKRQPLFNSADGQSPQATFPRQFVSGVERCNFHDIVKSRRHRSTDESGVPAAHQHFDKALGQVGLDSAISSGRPKVGRVGVYRHMIVDAFSGVGEIVVWARHSCDNAGYHARFKKTGG